MAFMTPVHGFRDSTSASYVLLRRLLIDFTNINDKLKNTRTSEVILYQFYTCIMKNAVVTKISDPFLVLRHGGRGRNHTN